MRSKEVELYSAMIFKKCYTCFSSLRADWLSAWVNPKEGLFAILPKIHSGTEDNNDKKVYFFFFVADGFIAGTSHPSFSESS